MTLHCRAFLTEMILVAGMLLVGFWWFGDCLNSAEAIYLNTSFGSTATAAPTYLPVRNSVPNPIHYEKHTHSNMRSTRGFREM